MDQIKEQFEKDKKELQEHIDRIKEQSELLLRKEKEFKILWAAFLIVIILLFLHIYISP